MHFNKILVNHGVDIDPQKQNQMKEEQAAEKCKNMCKECWKAFI